MFFQENQPSLRIKHLRERLKIFLPVQSVNGSPTKPGGHTQRKLPSRFVHKAPLPHGVLAHSSAS